MVWDCYHLSFRLTSPLHVGSRKNSNLMETRPYLPGKVLWAALTARVTRNMHPGSRGEDYKAVGDKIEDNMRFGYLWPAIDKESPLFPWDSSGDFEYRFIGSRVSTAMNYEHFSALEGSLHEVEFISPMTRYGEPVWLVGELWVRRGLQGLEWQAALANVQIGGERSYGWGRVELASELIPLAKTVIADPEDFTWMGYFPAHVRANSQSKGKVEGWIEPLAGWETSISGSQGLGTVAVAYAPGCRLAETEANKRIHFRIGRYGVWEFLEAE